MEKKDFLKVAGLAGWVTGSLFILPLGLLAPFAYLSGFFRWPDLIRLMLSPIPFGLILTHGVLVFLVHRWNLLQAHKKLSEGRWNPQEARFHGRMLLGIFGFFLIWEGLFSYLIVDPLMNIQFPEDHWIIPFFVWAFILMSLIPLAMSMLRRYELLVRKTLPGNFLVFSLKLKNGGFIGLSFIGVILMFILIKIILDFSQGILGRPIPWDPVWTFLLAGAVAFGSLIFLLVQQYRFVIRPITALVENFEAGSQGDFTQAMKLESTDEVGQLVHMSNELFAKLRESFSEVRQLVENLQGVKTALGSQVAQVGQSIQGIHKNLDSTKAQMLDHSSHVIETTAAVEQLARNIDSLGDHIVVQSQTVQKSQGSLGNLLQANQELQTLTQGSLGETQALVTTSQESDRRIQAMVQRIHTIKESSQHLMEANQLIAGVAAQTNLLAMNAAIEAAHAGDAGRGFSVVADEIRKLAEKASLQSKTISSNLKALAGDIEGVGGDSEKVQSSFAQIASQVQGVQNNIRTLADFMTQVRQVSEQIHQALNENLQSSSLVTQGSQEMRLGNREIITAITALKDISLQVQEAVVGINEQAGAIAQVSGAMEVQNRQTDGALADLQQVLNRFKF